MIGGEPRLLRGTSRGKPQVVDPLANRVGGQHDVRLHFTHSPLIPASLITLSKRAASLWMNLPNSSGVLVSGSTPACASFGFMSGAVTALMSSAFSRLMISR